MSTDPYHAVQQEIEASLQTAVTLRASFLRIQNMMGGREEGEELRWAKSEVSAFDDAFQGRADVDLYTVS